MGVENDSVWNSENDHPRAHAIHFLDCFSQCSSAPAFRREQGFSTPGPRFLDCGQFSLEFLAHPCLNGLNPEQPLFQLRKSVHYSEGFQRLVGFFTNPPDLPAQARGKRCP